MTPTSRLARGLTNALERFSLSTNCTAKYNCSSCDGIHLMARPGENERLTSLLRSYPLS